MQSRIFPNDKKIKIHRRKIVSSRGAQIIYKASCKAIKHPIVAKSFQFNDPTLASSLEREAQLATLMTHPNIVHFHGITLFDDKIALIY
jgi:hypothetical protein